MGGKKSLEISSSLWNHVQNNYITLKKSMVSIPDITISIINTNNLEITLQCLESVYTTAGDLNLEIYVVNNACLDGSNEIIIGRFPETILIDQIEMLGFSTNNNKVLSKATGRYWMLLNDDTIMLPGSLKAMVDFMDKNPFAGVVGASLINQDETLQYCYDFLPNPFYEGLRPLSELLLPHPNSDGPFETGYVCGACLMVRAEAAREIGLLDTRFDPLYSEEVDWCYRFHQHGWKVFSLPEAKVIHLGEVSRRSSDINRYTRIYSKKAVYFRKHFGESTATLYKITFALNSFVKSMTWIILWLFRHPHAKKEFNLHWKIFLKSFSF